MLNIVREGCPIHCILPPHILRNIAKNGSSPQKNIALRTLALDTTARTARLTYALPTRAVRRPVDGAPKVQRTIYTCSRGTSLPGKVVRCEGQEKTSDPAVDEAYDGLKATFDFYAEVLNRNSIDDDGLHLDATVHYDEDYDNAFWNGSQMVFGDGDGTLFNRFTISLDVIAHELTHGVTADEVNLIYLNQPGALNESISDVFGSLVKQYAAGPKQTVKDADWLIGKGLLKNPKNALRSMKSPGTAYSDPVLGDDPQPDHMSKYVSTNEDNGGVHINSGIPNRAFYEVAMALGGHAWEKAGRIWYGTVRDKTLRSHASFASFARHSATVAGRLYGHTSVERKAVIEGWGKVGIEIS